MAGVGMRISSFFNGLMVRNLAGSKQIVRKMDIR